MITKLMLAFGAAITLLFALSFLPQQNKHVGIVDAIQMPVYTYAKWVCPRPFQIASVGCQCMPLLTEIIAYPGAFKHDKKQTCEGWVVKLLTEKLCCVALVDVPNARRLPSSCAARRKKLPSASGMNLTIMQQQQGVMTYSHHIRKACLVEVESLLYMNYRCNAYQVKHAR